MHLQTELENIAAEYFKLSDDEKLAIAMEKGGKAWRGSFLVGDEVTSGIPDQKEGLYFGKELRTNVNETRPLHGVNLWPEGPLGKN
jgi:isopenicillin N synthase-like dioxygenase